MATHMNVDVIEQLKLKFDVEALQQLFSSIAEILESIETQEEFDNFVKLIDHTLDTGAWK